MGQQSTQGGGVVIRGVDTAPPVAEKEIGSRTGNRLAYQAANNPVSLDESTDFWLGRFAGRFVAVLESPVLVVTYPLTRKEMNELHLQDQRQGEELAEPNCQEVHEVRELSADELADVAGGPTIKNYE